MPDLVARETFESEVSGLIVLSWMRVEDEIRRGAEPNWQGMENEIARRGDEVLQAVSVAAAIVLYRTLTGETRVPPDYRVPTGQAASLAQSLVSTRQNELARATQSPGFDPNAFADQWFSASKAQGIAVTEVTSAVSAGEESLRQQYENIGVQMVAVWNNDPRSNVCQLCLPLDGLREEEWPAEARPGPPRHPNCLLGETPISASGLVAVWEAQYQGPIVRVRLSDGSSFAVTSNHLLLSSEGWLPACCFRKGDYLLGGFDAPVPSSPSDGGPDDDHQPVPIEKVVHAFSESGSVSACPMPTSPEDFHGDAFRFVGEVNVVGPFSQLGAAVPSKIAEPSRKLGLEFADLGIPLSSQSDLRAMFRSVLGATHGSVGGLRDLLAFSLGHRRHSDAICFRSGPWSDPERLKAVSNGSTAYSEFFAHCKNALPSVVSGLQVVDIDIESHDAVPVFDVETVDTIYSIGSGVVSSNCRCFLTYEPE